jgi:hypothetical protein
MDNKEKTLLETPKFNIVERDDKPGVVSKVETVMILPFINDQHGLPLMIGVLKEKNKFRDGEYSRSLITGTCEDEDPDYLSTSKRELLEESGYNVEDNDRWYFLGSVTGNKFVDKEYACFGVNVTGIEKGEAEGDGSKSEKEAIFHFIPANDVVKSQDIFIPGLFLKLFKFVVGMDIYSRDDSQFVGDLGIDNLEL